MVKFTILAGGYTSFIVSYLFNSDTSTLTMLQQSPTGPNPSWIASHPTNSSILYAVNEVDSGALQSFDVGPSGVISKPQDTVSSGGSSPAFTVPLVSGQVAVMNFGSGNGLIIPTQAKAERFGASGSATPISFTPPAGGASHPHMALAHGSEVFVPDLGADKIWRLVENGSPGRWKVNGFIGQPKGSGPRHIAIRDNQLYTLHELSSTLTLQNIPLSSSTTAPLLANVSIVPSNPPAGAKFAAGEILISHPSSKFPNPYVYVSNRNTGKTDSRGDTIAIFEHVTKTSTHRRQQVTTDSLVLVVQVYTGLNQIRGMQLGRLVDGGDEYLVASGVVGTGGVVIFKRTNGGRNLVEVARNRQIATRTSFVWV